jgi:hypothetical protein
MPDEIGEMVRLEAEVEARRERVAASLGELRHRLQRATSWRYWAASHLTVWIAAGVCLGFIVGSRRER